MNLRKNKIYIIIRLRYDICNFNVQTNGRYRQILFQHFVIPEEEWKNYTDNIGQPQQRETEHLHIAESGDQGCCEVRKDKYHGDQKAKVYADINKRLQRDYPEDNLVCLYFDGDKAGFNQEPHKQ